MSAPAANGTPSPVSALRLKQTSRRQDSVDSISSTTSQQPPPIDPDTFLASHGNDANAAVRQLLSDKHSLASQNAQLWKLIEKQRLIIHNLQRDCQKLAGERDALAKGTSSIVQATSPSVTPVKSPNLTVPSGQVPSSQTSPIRTETHQGQLDSVVDAPPQPQSVEVPMVVEPQPKLDATSIPTPEPPAPTEPLVQVTSPASISIPPAESFPSNTDFPSHNGANAAAVALGAGAAAAGVGTISALAVHSNGQNKQQDFSIADEQAPFPSPYAPLHPSLHPPSNSATLDVLDEAVETPKSGMIPEKLSEPIELLDTTPTSTASKRLSSLPTGPRDINAMAGSATATSAASKRFSRQVSPSALMETPVGIAGTGDISPQGSTSNVARPDTVEDTEDTPDPTIEHQTNLPQSDLQQLSLESSQNDLLPTRGVVESTVVPPSITTVSTVTTHPTSSTAPSSMSYPPNYNLTPDMLPYIAVNVPASKIRTGEKGKETLSFIIRIGRAVNPGDAGRLESEMWSIEKYYVDFLNLDSKLRSHTKGSKLPKLPDKALFRDHAPNKVDQRKLALEQYVQQLLTSPLKEPLDLSRFLSSDIIGNEDSSWSIGHKEGYLTKRGKNFGGWKTRYFVLDSPILEYYESKGGVHLGSIRLTNAQIGRQSQSASSKEKSEDGQDSYRHAFLILEKKQAGGKESSKEASASARHVLCAESDHERDIWVEALLRYVSGDYVGPDGEERQVRHHHHHHGRHGSPRRPSRDVNADTVGMRYDDMARGNPPSDLATGPNGDLISPPINGAPIADPKSFNSREPLEDDRKAKGIKSFWNNFGNSNNNGGFNRTGGSPARSPVFGVNLEDSIAAAPAPIDIPLPAVVYRCIRYLEIRDAASEEGIYRLSGSSSTIKALKERFNTEGDVDLLAKNEEYYDVHAIAGLLKLYLRELPMTILTSHLRAKFTAVIDIQDRRRRVAELAELVRELPPENYCLLRALSGHLLLVIRQAAVNKMSIRNVGIVFSPTLNIPAGVFSLLLTEYDYIFWNGEGEEPVISEEPSSPVVEKRRPHIPAGMPTSAAYAMHDTSPLQPEQVSHSDPRDGEAHQGHENKSERCGSDAVLYEQQNHERRGSETDPRLHDHERLGSELAYQEYHADHQPLTTNEPIQYAGVSPNAQQEYGQLGQGHEKVYSSQPETQYAQVPEQQYAAYQQQQQQHDSHNQYGRPQAYPPQPPQDVPHAYEQQFYQQQQQMPAQMYAQDPNSAQAPQGHMPPGGGFVEPSQQYQNGEVPSGPVFIRGALGSSKGNQRFDPRGHNANGSIDSFVTGSQPQNNTQSLAHFIAQGPP